jgi:hypothetical protein
VAADHDAVNRNALARPDASKIADRNVADRNLDFPSVVHGAHHVGLQVEKPLDRLGAARLDDERQPLREDVIGNDHHCHGEERCGRIAGRSQREADDAAGNAGKGPQFEQHMLIENAAAKRLGRHIQDMATDAEEEDDGKSRNNPRRRGRKAPAQLPGEQRDGRCRQADRAAECRPEPARPQYQEDERQQAGEYECRQNAGP